MKILIFSAHEYEIPYFQKGASHKHEVSFTDKKLSLKTAEVAKGYEVIVIFTADDASGEVVSLRMSCEGMNKQHAIPRNRS